MLASFLVSELALILAPTGKTNIFTYLFPNRITYQHVLFLHQLFLFFSVALSRVAPLFSPPDDDPRTEKAILEKTQILASMADREGKPPFLQLSSHFVLLTSISFPVFSFYNSPYRLAHYLPLYGLTRHWWACNDTTLDTPLAK